MQTDEMKALLARVKAAAGPDRELDYFIWFMDRGERAPSDLAEIWPDAEAYNTPCPAYTASIDAAVALVERCIPGAHWNVMADGCAWIGLDDADIGDAWNLKAPALALCAALLAALLRALLACPDSPNP